MPDPGRAKAATSASLSLAPASEAKASRPTSAAKKSIAAPNDIAQQQERAKQFLAKRDYDAAIPLLTKLADLKEPQFQETATWAKQTLPTAQEQHQKLREAAVSACQKARALMLQCDYLEAVHALELIPAAGRTTELRQLLAESTDLADECSTLRQEIDDSIKRKKYSRLRALLERYLKLKPGNAKMERLLHHLEKNRPARAVANFQEERVYYDVAGRLIEPKELIQYVALLAVICLAVYRTTDWYFTTYMEGTGSEANNASLPPSNSGSGASQSPNSKPTTASETKVSATPVVPNADVASTIPAPLVYLDEIQEIAFEGGWGPRVGKRGYTPDFAAECPPVNGAKVTHSLFPHTKENGHSYVTYRLNDQYATFKATVCNDSDRFLTFEVRGDDRPLWTSKETNKKGSSELCSVSVKGVQTLQLRIYCRGSAFAAWGWWIDPCLLTGIDLRPQPQNAFNIPTSTPPTAITTKGASSSNDFLPQPKITTLIPTSEQSGQAWRYLTSKPKDDWQKLKFDDSKWITAFGGFGEPSTPGSVVRRKWKSKDIWLRRNFELPADLSFQTLRLRIHHDEEVDVYLNGVLVFREGGYTTQYVDRPLNDTHTAILKPGTNTLAVYCRQRLGGQYIDVGLVGVEKATK